MLDDNSTIDSSHMFSRAVRLSRLSAGPAVKRRQCFAWHSMVLELSERTGMHPQVTLVSVVIRSLATETRCLADPLVHAVVCAGFGCLGLAIAAARAWRPSTASPARPCDGRQMCARYCARGCLEAAWATWDGARSHGYR